MSSLEGTTRSFTHDYLDPRTRNRRGSEQDTEITHWHSSPLAFAILPAVGGLLFQNGSAFVTDILLLGLAAIFMNWSIRLPWDWYYSAQVLRRDIEPVYDAHHLADDTAVDSASSPEDSPKASTDSDPHGRLDSSPHHTRKREQAAADLRQQELLALSATFVFPVLAAYLLHVIRAQLSGPSNGLVSDYNLSIFMLAAEIRPVRQVIQLVASRTLHLQRTVTGNDDPFASAMEDKSTIDKLEERITDLEAKLSEHALVPQNVNVAQKGDVSDLSTEIKKRYEPRLEGLERAVRRYEKRSATMAIMTEQRLQHLDTRLQETLSLAAVAAQHSQSPGAVSNLFGKARKTIAFPLRIAYKIITWPVVLLDQAYREIRVILLGPSPPPSSKRKSNRIDVRGKEDSRTYERGTLRKVVR
jgi:hypothetical protein